MKTKPNKVVYDAWKAVNSCCDVGDGHKWDTCLVHLAKDSLHEFNINKRDVDKGVEVVNFSKDDKEYDKEKLRAAFEGIDEICKLCEGYHNDCCPVSNARKAVEILLFGKFRPFNKVPFGEFLIQNGVVDKNQVNEVYLLQKEINLTIPTIALAAEYMIPEDVVKIFNKQKSSSKEFEDIALEMNLITESQVKVLKCRQKKCFRFIGDMFVILGYLTENQRIKYLDMFKALGKKNR